MFIVRQQHPSIEFIPDEGQREPHLVHTFSDRGEPFRSVLPLLVEGIGQAEERVLLVESPLSEMLDWTIEMHKHPDMPLVDEQHRAFFAAIKTSLEQAIAKIDGLEYACLDDEEDEC